MMSIITPSIRQDMLEIVKRCLDRQTFEDFEWIIVGPRDLISVDISDPNMPLRSNGKSYYFVTEPPKKEGDYYSLNKAWNEGFRRADGDLVISIVDGLWFEPTLLERLWQHYEANPKAIVGCIGHQYDQIINGKPEYLIWRDPRARDDFGSFYEVEPTEVEWCIVSIPKKALFDIGGLDEKYDQGAALSEKEANLRMQKAGYKLYLDQSIEYRAIKHDRLSKEWDEKYKIACEFWKKDAHEVFEGRRLKLNYL